MNKGEKKQKGARFAALRRAGAFLWRHKVLTGLVIGAAVFGAFGIAHVLAGPGSTAAAGPAYDYVRTVTLARTTLRNAVTVTGTVTTGQTANVTADETVRTYQVASVNVEVGDTVREGDVIATLDTTSLQKQIETARQSYQDDLKAAQTNYDRAVDDYEIAAVQHDNKLIDLDAEIGRADEKLAEAQKAENDARAARDAAASARDAAAAKNNTYAAELQAAKNEVSTFQAAYNDAAVAQDNALIALNNAIAAYNSAMAAVNCTGEDACGCAGAKDAAQAVVDAYRKYNSDMKFEHTCACETSCESCKAVSNLSPSAEADSEESATKKFQAAKQALEDVQKNVYSSALGLMGLSAIEGAAQGAQSDLEMAESELASAERSLETATTNRKTAEQQVKTAHDNYDNEKNGTNLMKSWQNVEDARTRLEQAKRTPENLTTLQEKLAKCTLTATMSGTVTELNAIVGSVSTGAVATIQDVDALVVEVTIPADNVPALSLGMPCNISSDATGDAVIQGMLTQIDPIANDKGSFNAKVRVNDSAAGLLVGVQAQVDIIENATNNVFTVPIDAVGTDANGGSYVLRCTGGTGVNMTFAQVPVTTGAANDYDVEISAPDLMEGDIIRASADLSEGIVSGAANAGASTGPSFSGGPGGPGGNVFAPVG